jgi:hypothetical protein
MQRRGHNRNTKEEGGLMLPYQDDFFVAVKVIEFRAELPVRRIEENGTQ